MLIPARARTLLAGASLALAAVLIAACDPNDPAAGTAASAPATASAAPASSAAAGSASATPTPPPSSAPASPSSVAPPAAAPSTTHPQPSRTPAPTPTKAAATGSCGHHTVAVCGWDVGQQPVAANEMAECNDGTPSYSTTPQGTCSHHGGVRYWFK